VIVCFFFEHDVPVSFVTIPIPYKVYQPVKSVNDKKEDHKRFALLPEVNCLVIDHYIPVPPAYSFANEDERPYGHSVNRVELFIFYDRLHSYSAKS
jgi:hypothetical protein